MMWTWPVSSTPSAGEALEGEAGVVEHRRHGASFLMPVPNEAHRVGDRALVNCIGGPVDGERGVLEHGAGEQHTA